MDADEERFLAKIDTLFGGWEILRVMAGSDDPHIYSALFDRIRLTLKNPTLWRELGELGLKGKLHGFLCRVCDFCAKYNLTAFQCFRKVVDYLHKVGCEEELTLIPREIEQLYYRLLFLQMIGFPLDERRVSGYSFEALISGAGCNPQLKALVLQDVVLWSPNDYAFFGLRDQIGACSGLARDAMKAAIAALPKGKQGLEEAGFSAS